MLEDTHLLYGLGTYAVLLGSWLIACAPFALLDATGWAERYRIQKTADGKRVQAFTSPQVRAVARRLVLVNWAWLLPAVVLAAPLLRRLFPEDAPAPALARLPVVFLVWYVLHDMSFYCCAPLAPPPVPPRGPAAPPSTGPRAPVADHRTLHEVPWLYRRFHKPHHLCTSPFAWSSHAVHPVEMMLQSVGAMTGPLIWSALYGLPIRTWWCWLALVQLQGVMDHTGYELPGFLDPFARLPGFGGTKFHDDHHKYFMGNYAAAFSIIDDVMGTRLRRR